MLIDVYVFIAHTLTPIRRECVNWRDDQWSLITLVSNCRLPFDVPYPSLPSLSSGRNSIGRWQTQSSSSQGKLGIIRGQRSKINFPTWFLYRRKTCTLHISTLRQLRRSVEGTGYGRWVGLGQIDYLLLILLVNIPSPTGLPKLIARQFEGKWVEDERSPFFFLERKYFSRYFQYRPPPPYAHLPANFDGEHSVFSQRILQ